MERRELTRAQHARLERMAAEEDDAKVIGWDGDGPLVRRPDGKVSKVGTTGRLRAARRWVWN